MNFKLSRQQRQQLLDWAEEAGDFECCGLILGRGLEAQHVELTKNVAINPRTAFEIDPAALIKAEKAARRGGPQILAYFHSHPNGRIAPSDADAAAAADDGRFWLIIAQGQITSWRPARILNPPGMTFVAQGAV